MSENHNKTQKTCAYCEKILHGRSDQRYCNDACRNTYNRHKRAAEKIEDHENTLEIFRIIKRNYEILKARKPPHEKDSYIWIEDHSEILKEGFKPKFFTSISQQEDGTWCCVFEYGFQFGEKQMSIRWLPEQAKI